MQILLLSPYPQVWPKVLPAPAKQSEVPQPLSPSAPSALPLPPPPSLPSNPYEGATNYPSLAAAVQPILASHPQVVAFGESHPQLGYDYRSAKRAFAEEILPLLAQEGIKDLIVEQILNDPAIIAELNKFFKTGNLDAEATPVLWDSFRHYTDKEDLIKLLVLARKLGIRIRPGGMTLAQAQETIWREDWCCNTIIQLKGWQYAEQAGRQQIKLLLESGKRFAIYNGVKHHQLVSGYITPEEGGTNYGRYLTNILGANYTEFELYPVGGLRTLNANLLQMWGVPDWKEQVPAGGVNRLERNNSNILIYN